MTASSLRAGIMMEKKVSGSLDPFALNNGKRRNHFRYCNISRQYPESKRAVMMIPVQYMQTKKANIIELGRVNREL